MNCFHRSFYRPSNWGNKIDISCNPFYSPFKSSFNFIDKRYLSQKSSKITLPLGLQSPNKIKIGLNELVDNIGARKKSRRVGRGIGSGRGKTAGRGHKGQNSRTGGKRAPQFEGGTSPHYKRLRKYGFSNAMFKIDYEELNLDELQYHIEHGRLDIKKPITMQHLKEAGIFKKIKDGVKLLSRGSQNFNIPVHLQLTASSAEAKLAVQKAGGSVTTVYYSKIGLRYIINPEKWIKKGRLVPKAVEPPAIYQHRYDTFGLHLGPPLAKEKIRVTKKFEGATE